MENVHSAIFGKLFSRQMFELEEAPYLSIQFFFLKECSSEFRSFGG
jgi:hypothetical protein